MTNESRMYRLMNVRPELIVDAVKSYLKMQKGMDTQSAKTTEGYVIQASQPHDAWKTLSGTRLAITVYMTVINDMINVTIGEGQWADKIGAGAVGWFVSWPFAVTAIVGAFRQKNLPTEIFTLVERTIYTGGKEVMVQGSGAVLAEGEIACPDCKSHNPEGSQFCNNCGAKLNNNCPNCGAQIVQGVHFCNKCGTKLD